MTEFLKTSETLEADACTLSQEYYTNKQLLEMEFERLFQKNWLCAGRADQLERDGNFITLTVGKENVILVRSSDGEINAFYNVCRHRGTRLCNDEQGRFSKSIQCPYHGWTYDLQGKLIGAPLMEAVEGFARDDYPLHSLPLAEWEGFLFINLSDSPKPFQQAFESLLNRFDDWEMNSLVEHGRHDYKVNCNWKLIVQNYSECYHCPMIHPELAEITPFTGGRNDLFEGPFLGGYMDIAAGKESITGSGHFCAPLLGDLSENDRHRVYYYSIFPNMLLSLHPDYVMVHTVWPVTTDCSFINCLWLFSPALSDENGYHPQEAIDFWHRTNQQDWNICKQAQLGIESKKYAPAPYSGQESLLAAFDRYYLSELRI
ncbi:MAG: aromatic ring-hydroxylating dioxygenase subunit alpha [Candidatus Neomarinimicrobiota bacterium]|nr:aromatic ring-hydroxylating dioxygenase subunit alpha [Candidatus Neomarinimicrobiota bacterium]